MRRRRYFQLFWRSDNGCYDFRQPVASVAASGSCPAHQHILTSHYDTTDPVPDTGCYVARAVHANGELGPPSDEVCPAVDPLPGVDCLVGYLPGTGCPDPPDLVATRSIRYFLTDHLGTPRTIARADGGPVADTMQLGPFGEAMDAPSCAQRRQFTGHERDDETGLDYMMARYYGRGMGRFLSVDPVRGTTSNPRSWNAYVYVENNPVRHVDPTGEILLRVAPSETGDSEHFTVIFEFTTWTDSVPMGGVLKLAAKGANAVYESGFAGTANPFGKDSKVTKKEFEKAAFQAFKETGVKDAYQREQNCGRRICRRSAARSS